MVRSTLHYIDARTRLARRSVPFAIFTVYSSGLQQNVSILPKSCQARVCAVAAEETTGKVLTLFSLLRVTDIANDARRMI
jgi:hypothetical protein